MESEIDAFLEHHGIKGMKWGVIRDRLESGARAAASSEAGQKAKTAARAAASSEAGQKAISKSKSTIEKARNTETGQKASTLAKKVSDSELHGNYSAKQIRDARANVAKQASAGKEIDKEQELIANHKTTGEKAVRGWLSGGISLYFDSNNRTATRVQKDNTAKQIKRGQKWIEAGYGS